MRTACLLVAAAAGLSGGCSHYIACAGTDVIALETQSQVRERLGRPDDSLQGATGWFDEYHTRRKVSEAGSSRVTSMGMGIAMTFGFVEFLAFPAEVYLLVRRTLGGQSLRFNYDSAGRVTGIFLDGERLDWKRSVASSDTGPMTPPQEAEGGSPRP